MHFYYVNKTTILSNFEIYLLQYAIINFVCLLVCASLRQQACVVHFKASYFVETHVCAFKCHNERETFPDVMLLTSVTALSATLNKTVALCIKLLAQKYSGAVIILTIMLVGFALQQTQTEL